MLSLPPASLLHFSGFGAPTIRAPDFPTPALRICPTLTDRIWPIFFLRRSEEGWLGPQGGGSPKGGGGPKFRPFFPLPMQISFFLLGHHVRAQRPGPPGCRTMTLGSWTPSEKTDRNWRRERNKKNEILERGGWRAGPIQEKAGWPQKIWNTPQNLAQQQPNQRNTPITSKNTFFKFDQNTKNTNFCQIRSRPTAGQFPIFWLPDSATTSPIFSTWANST